MLAHQAGGVLAQRDHAGAGERGDVDQRLRLEALRVGQRVAQDQAAFGVGVADFDGLAGHRGEHVGRAVAVGVGHVLDRRHDHHQVDRQLHADRGHERAHHAGGAAHVVLHLLDAALGLEVDAAGIEGDALADQHVGLGVAAVAATSARSAWAGWPSRAPTASSEPMPSSLHLRAVEHFARGLVEAGGELLRLLRRGRPGCRCSAAGCRARARTARRRRWPCRAPSAALSSPRMDSVREAGFVALLVAWRRAWRCSGSRRGRRRSRPGAGSRRRRGRSTGDFASA